MSGNGEYRQAPEEMTERERSIELVRTVRTISDAGGDLFERFGVMLKSMQALTDATLMLVSAYRSGRMPSTPPGTVTGAAASVLPPSQAKQQSAIDLDAIARQAASILDVESGVGEDTKITRITSNTQVLLGVIESARNNAYNRAQRTARLKTIGVWIGIVGGAIPVVTVFAALCLWVLRLALAYLGK